MTFTFISDKAFSDLLFFHHFGLIAAEDGSTLSGGQYLDDCGRGIQGSALSGIQWKAGGKGSPVFIPHLMPSV